MIMDLYYKFSQVLCPPLFLNVFHFHSDNNESGLVYDENEEQFLLYPMYYYLEAV